MSKFLNHFDPSGKKFIFHFTKDTCKKIGTGVCALDNFDKDIQDYDYYRDKKRFSKCQNIYFGIKTGTINSDKMIPYIFYYDCGHYECGDGQHRMCVAQKCGMTLKVEVQSISEPCSECKGNNAQENTIEVDNLDFLNWHSLEMPKQL